MLLSTLFTVIVEKPIPVRLRPNGRALADFHSAYLELHFYRLSKLWKE
jgi:hypothetical protein